MGLRLKLFIALGGLLAILLAVGVISVYTVHDLTEAVKRIYRENIDTVTACYRMKDEVERLDRLAELSLAASKAPGSREIESAVAEFENNLKFQQGNITVPGEKELTEQLAARWQAYRQSLERFLRLPESSPVKRQEYGQQLLPRSQEVREAAQSIIEINLKNVLAADGQAHQRSRKTRNAMIFLVGMGSIMALVFFGIIGPRIIKPIMSLTRSVREIQQGHLDLAVSIPSGDEIGELAAAFNEMAAGLREFRRSDQARLLRTRQSTQIALNTLADAVVICNLTGDIEMANEAAQRLFGLHPEGRIGDSTGKIGEFYNQALGNERPVRAQGFDAAMQVFQEGRERFFLPEAIPIVDEFRQMVGVTLVLRDVTRLRQLDEAKSGLIATVAHELKTPLTSVRLAFHVLLEEKIGPLTPKQAEILAAGSQDAERLQHIISNLLDMGRMEAGRADLKLQPVSVDQLLLQATEGVRTAFTDKGVTLAMEVGGDVPPVVVEAERLQHVFVNLLNNALRSTPPGGTVQVTARPAGDMVSFSVADTGAGIPAEYLPQIFEKFFRVPGQETSDTGLGLAIAKEIIEAHGGRIEAASQVGQGTTITFTLRSATPVRQPT